MAEGSVRNMDNGRPRIVPAEKDKGGNGGKGRSGRLKKLLLVLLILVLAGGGVYLWWSGRYMSDYAISWENTASGGMGESETFKGYELFSDGVINYSRDGASFVDREGDAIWERSYQMNSPRAFVNGDHAAIADIGGTSLYIFDDENNTGSVSSVLPIITAAISQQGVVYVVTSDGDSEYINAYREDGSAIELTVRSLITGDGYPLCISASPDGSQLITAYVSIDGSSIMSQVIFRNFDAIGQNADAKRIVGGFADEFAGHLVGRVHFSDDEHSQAFYDGGIVFFSTRVLTSPEVIGRAEIEGEMLSIACSERYVAAIVRDTEGEMPYRLLIYEADGDLAGEAAFDMQYTGFDISGKEIYVYNDSELRIYTAGGREKAYISADEFSISKVVKGKLPSSYMIVDGNDYIGIDLQ